MYVGDSFLRCEYVPDPIAGTYDKLGVGGDCLHFQVGVGGDCLVLRRQVRVILVFKVAEGARQGQSTVDTALLNKVTRRLDASQLSWIVRLVIDREILRSVTCRHD